MAMLPANYRIARIQKTLRWFEEDIPQLNLRLQGLSAEHQRSARKFASAVIDHTRAELHRLLQEQPENCPQCDEPPCEPAD